MRFKDFLLQEVGTSTGDIAGFRRMSIPLTRRMWPPNIAAMVSENPPDVPGKKKKPMMQPQVKENTAAGKQKQDLDRQATKLLKKSGFDRYGRPLKPIPEPDVYTAPAKYKRWSITKDGFFN